MLECALVDVGVDSCGDGCPGVWQNKHPEDPCPLDLWTKVIIISRRKVEWRDLRPISGYDLLNRATTSSWSMLAWLRELRLHHNGGNAVHVLTEIPMRLS